MKNGEFEQAAHEMHERVSLLKAHWIGRDETPPSNVKDPTEENFQTSQNIAGALDPPYSLEMLGNLTDHSCALRPNIDAYAVNIDAFGYRFEPVIDMTSADANQKIKSDMYLARLRDQEKGTINTVTEPSDDEVKVEREKIIAEMRIEKSKAENFFKFCVVRASFVSLRRVLRNEIETFGNGYWEVIRDKGGTIVQLSHVPAFTVRLMRSDPKSTITPTKLKINDTTYDEMLLPIRFRRFVQVFESSAVYFREFGDRRIVSRKDGEYFATVADLKKRDPFDEPASDIIHFKIHNWRGPYGVPRWIGALLAVLGSRHAEEVNYLYFENKSVPPLALLVSGGRVTGETVDRVRDYIENELKGKRNFHRILVLEAEPAANASAEQAGRMKIELKPLTGAQQSDALFQKYDERNNDKVGIMFRNPRIVRGDVRDFNRATADSALGFAEMQVYGPEREDFDETINRTIMVDLGIRYWTFRSNAPVTRNPAELTDMIEKLVKANVLTPEEGRMLAEGVFNREFKAIKADWVKQPVVLTLAGVKPAPEMDELGQAQSGVNDVAMNDLATADLQAGGIRQGGSARNHRSEAPSGSLDNLLDEARRLIAMRGAIRKAEAEAVRTSFEKLAESGSDEMEREIVRVPRHIFESFFAKESTDAPGGG